MKDNAFLESALSYSVRQHIEKDTGIATEEKALTVEEWLNSVSYSNDPNYVPSVFAIHFVEFIKLATAGQEGQNKTPVLHYKMLDQVAGPTPRIANMVHRGAAKTTVLGEFLFLYLAVYGEIPGFGPIPFAIYVSDSIDNGVKNMRKNLEFRREESPFLMEHIPEAKFTDIHWEFKNKDGNVFIVKGYGAKTGVRGAKARGKRPVLAVLDDLVSDEDARSATVIESIEATVYKAVDYALDPTRSKIIWSGTPFNAGDPLYKAVESGQWKVNVYPVCERFPCTREEFRGSWPDRFGYDYVNRKYREALGAGKIDTFNQELMLRIMSDEDRLITDEELQWYRIRNVAQHRSNFNFYITTDFATSEKQSADFSFISVWAYNNAGHWFWVDGICARQTMDKNLNDLFRLVQKYRPQSVGIEVTGQQGGFIPWIKEEQFRRNIFFQFASDNNSKEPGIRPSTDKLRRFNVVVPWFKLGMIHFPLEMRNHPALKELILEIRQAAVGGFKSKHDDGIDTVSMLALMDPWKPSEETYEDDEGDIWGESTQADTGTAYDNYIV